VVPGREVEEKDACNRASNVGGGARTRENEKRKIGITKGLGGLNPARLFTKRSFGSLMT